MNVIAKSISFKGKVLNDIDRAKSEAETERLIVLEETSRNVQKNAILRERIRVTQAKAKQERSGAKKSSLYCIMAMLFTVVSFVLSALGITGARRFNELFADARATIITLMLLSISVMLYVVSTQQNFLRTRYNIDHNKLKILQVVVITISVIGNYIFLKSIMNPTNTFEYFVTIVFSAIPDYVCVVFGGMAQNVKYSNNSYEVEKLAETPLQMLGQIIKKRLTMLLYKPYKKTYEKYSEMCDFRLGEKVRLIADTERVSLVDTLSENEKMEVDISPNFSPNFSPNMYMATKVLSEPKKAIKMTNKKPTKNSSNTYENALKKLGELQTGDVVSKSSLSLRCSDYEYRKIRERMKNENLIVTDGTVSRKA